MRRITVYGDLSWRSALASARVFDRGASSKVDHRLARGAASRHLATDGSVPPAETIAREMAELERLMTVGEHYALCAPLRQYNTRMACAGYAGTEPAHRSDVRRRLFAAVWENGEDLGDAAIVDRIVESTRPGSRIAVAAAVGDQGSPDRPIDGARRRRDSRGPNALIRLSRMIDDDRHEPCEADLGGEAPCFAHLVGEPTDTSPSSPER